MTFRQSAPADRTPTKLWFLLAIASLAFAATLSAQPRSWTINIGTSASLFRCRGREIPVQAAASCDAAVVAAREFFATARECIGACPRTVLEGVKASCKAESFTQRKAVAGRRFRVSLSWTCGRVVFDPFHPRRDCDEAAVLKDGTAVIPAGATEVEAPVDVDMDLGLISSLYPGQDTSTDGFYPLPCEPSIGGTLPPDVPPTQDEIDAEGTLEGFETGKGRKIAQQLQNQPMPAISPMQPLSGIECAILKPVYQLIPCSSPLLLMKDQPFEGRDIIYVHGLNTDHLLDRLNNPPPSSHAVHSTWPLTASEFLDPGKYYRSTAEAYWYSHIRENLFSPNQPSNPVAGWEAWGGASPSYRPKANRYVIVAWSTNQTIEYAQHALLTQIQLAITTNKNVVTPPTYPASSVIRPFCATGCVLISHSAGALVVDSAMGLAKVGFFGPGGIQLTQRMAAHVSLEGAISGSRLASIGMAVALAAVPVTTASNLLCSIADVLFKTNNSCNADTSFAASSILRDLMPVVAQGVWGPAVNATPVPTVTVAGGHPIGSFGVNGLAKPLLPGLDDGVVSMNSACGNPNPVLTGVLAPSGFAVLIPVKAFDFSTDPGRFARGAKNWLSHKNLRAIPPLPHYLAGACTPYVSPTGMVMPALAAFRYTPWDSRKRYNNHYSFLQGSIDHGYDPGLTNAWPSISGQGAGVVREYEYALTSNVEESSAVTDPAIYGFIDGNGTHLVHPSFARIHEVVRGSSKSFKLFGKKRTIWFWKRTYHLLEQWEVKQSSHYVYEFVARR